MRCTFEELVITALFPLCTQPPYPAPACRRHGRWHRPPLSMQPNDNMWRPIRIRLAGPAEGCTNAVSLVQANMDASPKCCTCQICHSIHSKRADTTHVCQASRRDNQQWTIATVRTRFCTPELHAQKVICNAHRRHTSHYPKSVWVV